MKHIFILMNSAFLFLMTSSVNAGIMSYGEMENNDWPQQPLLAAPEKVKKADKAFIKVIEKEIYNPKTPFPGEFGGNMKLTFIQRDKMNISLHLTSSETFERNGQTFVDPLVAADVISEGYFYFLPFLFNGDNSERGICRHAEFYPTQAAVKIKYVFPNIGYRTQLVKPLSEICGWANRDKTPSRDTSFNVTSQRNLFSSYMEVISQALTASWKNEYPNKTLSMRAEDETLIFTLEDNHAKKPMSEKDLVALFFPSMACQLIQSATLLDIKLRFETITGEEKVKGVFEKEAKPLCVLHTKNMFNLK